MAAPLRCRAPPTSRTSDNIVYVCAFHLDVGESLIQLVGRCPWWSIDGDAITTHNTHEILFTAVPQEDSDRAIARMKPFSYVAVTETRWHCGRDWI